MRVGRVPETGPNLVGRDGPRLLCHAMTRPVWPHARLAQAHTTPQLPDNHRFQTASICCMRVLTCTRDRDEQDGVKGRKRVVDKDAAVPGLLASWLHAAWRNKEGHGGKVVGL